MRSLYIPVTWIECFTYPRLIANDLVIGYDFGVFVNNHYVVCGISKTREMVEDALLKWAESRDCPVNIFHEDEPSRSKNGKKRYE